MTLRRLSNLAGVLLLRSGRVCGFTDSACDTPTFLSVDRVAFNALAICCLSASVSGVLCAPLPCSTAALASLEVFLLQIAPVPALLRCAVLAFYAQRGIMPPK